MTQVGGVALGIEQLVEGKCEAALLFKVDRVFFPHVVHYVHGGKRLKQMMSVDLVVFDRSGSRILVTIEEDASIYVHARMFLEGSCYRSTNFVVRRNGKGFHNRFHIVLLKTSLVERAWELLPTYSFNLMSASEFASGYPWDYGIIDLCGTIVTMYETGVEELNGVYGRSVCISLKDKKLHEVWGCEVVTCYLHGQCAGETLRAHEGLNEVEDMSVIIQFVRPSFDVDRMGGHPTLTSVSDATRVLFDPSFPAVLRHRAEVLGEEYVLATPIDSPESVA